MIIHFTTDSFPLEHRIEMARDHYASVAEINVEPYGEEPFFAQARIHLLPGAMVADLERSPAA